MITTLKDETGLKLSDEDWSGSDIIIAPFMSLDSTECISELDKKGGMFVNLCNCTCNCQCQCMCQVQPK